MGGGVGSYVVGDGRVNRGRVEEEGPVEKTDRGSGRRKRNWIGKEGYKDGEELESVLLLDEIGMEQEGNG